MIPLSDRRKDYTYSRLDIDNLDINPIVQFRFWLKEAMNSEEYEPSDNS